MLVGQESLAWPIGGAIGNYRVANARGTHTVGLSLSYNPVYRPRGLQGEVFHLNMAAMLAAILKIQIHELGASVEKILYAKNPVEIRNI